MTQRSDDFLPCLLYDLIDSCRAVQVGLLTPLTFARYCLSPLAAFTLGATFFTMEGSDSEFANFTLPNLKAFWGACSQNVSGNKQ